MNTPREKLSLQDLVAAEREAAPDSAADARVWAGIEHRLVHGPPPPALPPPGAGLTLTAIKLIGGLLLTAGAVGGAIALAGVEEPVATLAPALPPLAARADEPADIPAPRLVPPPGPVAVQRSEAPAATPDPQLRARPVKTVKTGPADAAPPAVKLDLEAELRLVAGIRAALRRGDTAAALKAIAEHKRDFPDGALVQERSAHEVEAVCAAGRGDEARALADAFVRRWPESTHRARVAAACRGDDGA